jgi:hypothetical protein
VKPCSWVRNPAWDAFWLQSALWLAPLALLLAQGYDDPADGPLDLLVFLFTALFWISHRFASAWLAYATTAYRPLLRADPLRFAVVPLAIAAACFAILLPGDDALPFTRAERAMALASVDFVFVTYHFAAQHFGVLSLYRIRGGRAADLLARRLDRLFAMGAGGALVVVIEAVAQTTAFQEFGAAQWIDQERIAGAAELLRAVATSLVVALTLALLAVEARASSVSTPRVLYALGLAAMVCGGLHTERPFLFVAVWSTQHWLVATALATQVAAAEPAPADSRAWRALHAINRRPWVLLFVLGSISILLLPVMEVEAVKNEGTLYGERIFGALAAALRTSDWAPALLAFGFTTGFLHYWLDRAVYRLSHPAVRGAARGLFQHAVTPAASVSFRGPVPAPRLFHR